MIKNIVEGIIEVSGSRDPFEISNYLDITVLVNDLGDEVCGFFQKTSDDSEVIHINSSLDYHYKKYICAHELGHAILEPDLNISFFIANPLMIRSKSEIKADKFAAHLLIDDDVLNKIEYEGFSLEQIASMENIPVELLGLKFGIEI